MNDLQPKTPAAQASSTLQTQSLKSAAAWLACETPQNQKAFLDGLSEHAVAALPWLFEFWAMPHQLPPEGEWRTWVILGGRGAGKTRAGSEWVRAQVEGARPEDQGQCKRIALVGETYDQVRDVMIFGESGIMATTPPDRRPEWKAGLRKLVWPNGAEAQCFSAHDAEALRGPQFDGAWVDELAKWKQGQVTWDMLQFALRLGTDPQCVVTTTPRNVAVLKELLARGSTVQTHATTFENSAYLAKGFLEEVKARYGNTRLGRQELDGVLLEDVQGALWTSAMVEAARQPVREEEYDRVVIGLDPSVSGGESADHCGIIVVGLQTKGDPQSWKASVLADESLAARPLEWAEAAVEAARTYGADRIVAEVNQGGDLVEAMLRQVDPLVPYRAVRAHTGKALRAEPVAALYEQGRVCHVGNLSQLEDEMVQMTAQGYRGKGSPDRVDALVWALYDGLLQPASRFRRPRIRQL